MTVEATDWRCVPTCWTARARWSRLCELKRRAVSGTDSCRAASLATSCHTSWYRLEPLPVARARAKAQVDRS